VKGFWGSGVQRFRGSGFEGSEFRVLQWDLLDPPQYDLPDLWGRQGGAAGHALGS